MGSCEFDVLLGLVKNLHEELERYLTDTASSPDVVPRILGTCKQLRTMNLSEAAKYWLGAIERHAAQITRSSNRSASEGDLLTSSVFLGTQLLKDVYFLRRRLESRHDSIS